MLRRRPKQLICAELDSDPLAALQRYAVPPGVRTTISAATIANATASDAIVSITVLQQGDRRVRLVWNHTVPAGSSFVLPALIGQTIEAGSTLYADASVAATLHLTLSGYEESEA